MTIGRSRQGAWLDDALAAAISLGIACVVMLSPSAAILVVSRHVVALPAGEVLGAWVEILAGAWSDPASAFPSATRELMPGPVLWWTTVAATASISALLIFAVARRIDRLSARPTMGRRWHSLRGVRPRTWARPRDLDTLTVSGPQPERLTLGTIGRRHVQLAAVEETNLILVAPTRSGKTSRFAIPWTLEAPGPVISLSVKTDVFQVTAGHRARRGTVWLWDPFGESSAAWSPLHGCKDWSTALRRAAQLADARGHGRESEAAAFWSSEGAKLLAPLLHGAALAERDMGQVLYWLDERDEQRPKRLLEARRAFAAAAQLDAVLSLDPRNSGTTYMSAANLLEAYRHPAVQRTESTTGYTAEALLDGVVIHCLTSSRRAGDRGESVGRRTRGLLGPNSQRLPLVGNDALPHPRSQPPLLVGDRSGDVRLGDGRFIVGRMIVGSTLSGTVASPFIQ